MAGERNDGDGCKLEPQTISGRHLRALARAKMDRPNHPDQKARRPSEDHVLEKDALQLLPFESESPGEDSRCQGGDGCNGGCQKIEISRFRQSTPFSPLPDEIAGRAC